MGSGNSTHVRVRERGYEVAAEPELNVNDAADYLFVLPRTSGRLVLHDAAGRQLHDGGVGPGHVRVVAPGEHSSMLTSKRFESVVLSVPAARCLQLADEAGLDSEVGLFERRPVLRPHAPLHRMSGWLREAARTEDAAARGIVLSGLATALVGAVLGELVRPEGPRVGRFDPDQMREITEFAESRLATELTLAQWAACVGLSAAEFGRRFVLTFGVTPYTWYVDRRIDVAMTLLRDARITIGDVALQTGFGSQSHFTTAFRRRVGLPPGRRRNAMPRPDR